MKVQSRTPFDGSRQREALTALQRESGKAATAVAAEIGRSYNQYLRYVWGQTPLRIDQLETFAAAYGVPVRRLVDTIFCGPERVLGASATPPTPDDPPLWPALQPANVSRVRVSRHIARSKVFTTVYDCGILGV